MNFNMGEPTWNTFFYFFCKILVFGRVPTTNASRGMILKVIQNLVIPCKSELMAILMRKNMIIRWNWGCPWVPYSQTYLPSSRLLVTAMAPSRPVTRRRTPVPRFTPGSCGWWMVGWKSWISQDYPKISWEYKYHIYIHMCVCMNVYIYIYINYI